MPEESKLLAAGPIYGHRRPILVPAHPRRGTRGVRQHLRMLKRERDEAFEAYVHTAALLGHRDLRTGTAYDAYLRAAGRYFREGGTD